MIEGLSFKILSPELQDKSTLKFFPGIHIIYGESGSGKSLLFRKLAGSKTVHELDFEVRIEQIPAKKQVVFQNPETQIITHSIKNELVFSLECQEQDPLILQESLKELQKYLPFVKDWDRHPSTLSGGEKEILNLVTAFSTGAELVLIDDGLSFLNSEKKAEMAAFMRSRVEIDNCIILWFTSEKQDADYAHKFWNFENSILTEIGRSQHRPKYEFKRKPGNLNIYLEDFSFSYDPEFPLIQYFDAEISQCSCLGLYGQNGTGKSTLAKLMVGLLKPAQGKLIVEIDGETPSMAYLDQFPERILGAENLLTLLEEFVDQGKLLPQNVQNCINTLNENKIDWINVKNKSGLDLPWSTLRLSLMIILSQCEYDLLILDEPTFGMGHTQKLILSRLFKEILLKKHLILISHDLHFINNHCDQVMTMSQEKLRRKIEADG